jgi:lipid-binding SYLF domain-containing protein
MAGTIFTAMAVVLLFSAGNLEAGAKETKTIRNAVEVLEEITAIPEKGIPPSLLQDAQGIAVVPGVIKVGFVIGGRHGRGVLLIREKRAGWSNPVFVSITGGSVGWQIGAQSTDVILVFKSMKSIDGIMKGKFTLGADAAIAAGPVGRGLFAGVSVEGAALQIDDEANADFYGKEGIRAEELLKGSQIPSPPAAIRLKESLAKHTNSKAGE